MKAKLYSTVNNYVGSVTLPSTRVYPPALYLDESPKGGQRLFLHKDNDTYIEASGNIPTVKLDK